MSSKKKNLDVYLNEVFKQFIALKENELRKAQEVFKSVFELFKQKMGEQCNYFKKYASQVMYAGSVYDGIKVSKLDEFDMDIVIRLPVNYADDGENGIIIENDEPGFVKLKIIKAFDNLDKQKEWDTCHKVTREWRDTDKYLLQNKFRQWLHKIVQRTVNDLNEKVTVLGVTYVLTYRTLGPAYTLNIRNSEGDEEFLLDVDLVPVIRFMLPRWPEGYRTVENTQIKEWLVVPKPNKTVQVEGIKNRLWRLSFQDYERDMIKGCQGLKTTIRLVKKLRDELGMKAIASYYIKTLFLWKVEATDKQYWQRKISAIYREMVEELYNAITEGKIPYFWNKDNNLIQAVKPTVLQVYAKKLKEVLNSIDSNDVEKTVFFLLNTKEIDEFKNSEFYKNQAIDNDRNNIVRQASLCSVIDATQSPKHVDKKENDNDTLLNLVKSLMTKIDRLTVKIDEQETRLIRLENERLVNNVECVPVKDTIIEVKPLDVDLTESVNEINQDSRENVVSDLLIL